MAGCTEGAAAVPAPRVDPAGPSAASSVRAAAMVEDSESVVSQQTLELEEDTSGIDRDNEKETEHAKRSPAGDLGTKREKKKQNRKKEKLHSGGTKSNSASDSQEI